MKIQILTTPGCGNCAQVKKMLDDMKVKYERADIRDQLSKPLNRTI